MQVPQSVGREFYRQARGVVPAVLFMSVVLGLFNASEWTLAAVWPKVALSFGIGLLGCVFGLIALWIGLQVAVWRQDLMQGWLAGLLAGFAGIAFMLWYFANPVS